MIKRVRIQGLGPHVDFNAELDPRGHTTVSGPSEVGKTFLIESVTFALWGQAPEGRFRPEAISDDAARAEVELVLDSGRVVRRSITRGRSTTRSTGFLGDEESFSTEASFREALGELGDDVEAVRLVMVPMAWQALAAGNARKLRDVLARVLPGGDLPSTVRALAAEAGVEVTEAEAGWDEGEVSKARREARRLRDEAAGRLQLATERLSALEQGVSAEVDPPDAALVAAVEAWDAYDRALGARGGAADAARRAAAWDARRAELGDEPPRPPDTAADAEALAQAQARMQGATASYQQAAGQLHMVHSQLQMFAAGPDVCPMCQRGGWEQGQATAQQLQGQAQALQQAQAQAQSTYAQAEAMASHHGQAVQLADELRRAHERWSSSVRALGPRPEVPDMVEGPPEPEVPRPSPEQASALREQAARHQAAEQLRAGRDDQLAQAVASVEAERARHATADADADRYDALLDIVRRAPSALAARQAEALGDLSPVSLHFGDNPAVEVHIDGRPWWLASRGRQVVADAVLRAAVRRALELPYLPLFVDNTQDVGGQPLPELAGPVIWLQTNDGKGIVVRRTG